MQHSLDLDTLSAGYASGAYTPLEVIERIAAHHARTPSAGVFITETFAQAHADAQAVIARRARGETLPLYGIPFAVKDNIDVAGTQTTAACAAFAYRAERSAPIVERLIAAGAVMIGKTNLDQFATGLVGVRSPYGIPENPFDARYICGGSSSGSGAAVARGLCSFALGTDTAGSGRVPAAFNNIVGLKPTRGMLSTRGVVPACRSLDCVSVFALTVDDAATVASVMAGFDAEDPYARREAKTWDPRPGAAPPRFRFVVPEATQRVFDDAESPLLFDQAVLAFERAGGSAREVDFTPFRKAGALLYEGPWVAERLEASSALLGRDPHAFDPAVRAIFESAAPYEAGDVFAGMRDLSALRNAVDALWNEVDFLLVPTVPGHYRIDQVLADPLALNARLAVYANFVNLLDLCALAIPAGFRGNGLPFGVTLIARRGRDALLASIGRGLHHALVPTLGALGTPQPALRERPLRSGERAQLAVVGAHLSGEPLNRELTDLGARLLCATHTAPRYRLFALPTTPPKPGLRRVHEGEAGAAIELEVWELDNAQLGPFMRGVRAPLCIGTVELQDGSSVLGFLCESAATAGQRDISSFGGWRAFRRAG
jgi:allophanate hydrolase